MLMFFISSVSLSSLYVVNLLKCLVGGPLLLMELAFLLRGVGTEVLWITNQRPSGTDSVIYSLEHKMLDRGVQVVKHNLIYCFFSLLL